MLSYFKLFSLFLGFILCSHLSAQLDTGVLVEDTTAIVDTNLIKQTAIPATDTSLSMLDGTTDENEKVENAFKTTKIINIQSIEMLAAGVLDFKINHRFEALNTGLYNAFGLDGSTVRLGFEYGINKNLTASIGRSSFEKTSDLFLKYRFMQQTKNNKKPVTIFGLFSTAYTNFKFNYSPSFTQRLAYVWQVAIGKKFSDRFSAQLTPSMVHHNIVDREIGNNTYFLGTGFRYKLTNRTTFNFEWIPSFSYLKEYYNSLSIGFDIETGGHVFQLHLTNSIGMNESNFLARTSQTWTNGGIFFGFNISRVFTVVSPKNYD